MTKSNIKYTQIKDNFKREISSFEMLLSYTNYCDIYSNVQLTALKNDYDKYVHAALSKSTRIAYQADLAHFISWGGTIPSTPKIISQYLATHAELLSTSTLSRRVVALNRAHTSQGLSSPTNSDLVKATLRGIRRTLSLHQRQVLPVLKINLIEMIAKTTGVRGFRDSALLLIGFAGAFRRSELVALKITDIEFVEHGLVIHLRRSKTDQEGEGRKIAIPYARGEVCPVMALKNWLAVSEIKDGPLFRPVTRHGRIENSTLSTQAVAILVKQYATAIGLDATKFSGHSLRAGLVTSAAQAGVSTWKIKQQTGHKSDAMLNRYIRDARLFVDNALSGLL